VLTAIVIAFAITVVLATLAVVGLGDDDTEPPTPKRGVGNGETAHDTTHDTGGERTS